MRERFRWVHKVRESYDDLNAEGKEIDISLILTRHWYKV
jgi:hypothetical protein